MTIDERLEYIATLQQSHDEQIGKLIEKVDTVAERVDSLAEHVDTIAGHLTVLTERTIQAMDAINRLARIVENHENRIQDLEDQRPS